MLSLYKISGGLGRQLIAANVRFFQEHLPHVRVVGVAGGIHDLAFQQPERTAALIREFLSARSTQHESTEQAAK